MGQTRTPSGVSPTSPVTTQTPPTPPPGLAEFNRALSATKAGKYAEAETLYRQLLKKYPEASSAWANLALLQGRRGAFADAAISMGKAADSSPNTAAFRAQQSSFLLRAGNQKEAERAARKTLSLPGESRNVIALSNLGDILFQQKRYAEATPVLRTLASVEGKAITDRTEISLILSLGSSGQLTEALTLARKRSQRLPRDANSQLLQGDMARLSGRIDEAKAAYQRASLLDPKNANAKAALAFLAAQQGDRTQTIALVQQNLQKSPDDPRLHFQLGYLYYSDERLKDDERYSKAYGEFFQAATIDPKNPLYVTYSGIALMMGKPDEERWRQAKTLLEGALGLNPNYSLARMGLANMAEQTGKFAEAQTQYNAILAYAPKDAAARRGLAGTYYATGKREDAYREMEKLAKQDPNDVTYLSELASWQVADATLAAKKGNVAEAQARTEEAHKTYDRILQRKPDMVGALLAQGRLYENGNQMESAQKKYTQVLERNPKNADATLLLGQILENEKKPEEAISIYRKLLDADATKNSVRWQLALALRNVNRYDEAIAEMQAIATTQSDPNREMYLLGAPRLMMERNLYSEAVAELTRLRREYPDVKEISYALAEAQEKYGQMEAAEKTLQDIVVRSAKTTVESGQATNGNSGKSGVDVRPLTAKAEFYERIGKSDDAARAYEDTLRLDPTSKLALLGLSRVREKQGKPDAATTFVENLTLEDPKKPFLPALGAAQQLHIQTRTTAAFVAFTKRLLEKYPDVREVQYARARALTEEGSDYKPDAAARTEAIALYDKMLKNNAFDKEAQLQREALLAGRPTK
jgi:tetratricopeptide (TPR) repeat protein